jgi:peptidoglycan/xylan/chitin deacetylase (PgdA/CDA1 family)
MPVILWGLVTLFLMYAVLPRCIAQIFGFRVFQKGHSKRDIALTFDDGPHPIYTPLLLDLLKKFDVKATFFVLGAKAEKFPELIARIHQEGHLIGIHNYVHYSNWFLTPGQVRRQIEQTAAIVERITGERPVFYRPPWGLLNLFDLLTQKQFQIVMWSVMVEDWNRKVGAARLKERLLSKITGGSVILLHDSGDTLGADEDAPLQMLEALEQVVKEMRWFGYKFVRIDEMVANRHERTSNPHEKFGTSLEQ